MMIIRCKQVGIKDGEKLCALDNYPDLRNAGKICILLGEDKDTQTWGLARTVDVSKAEGIELIKEIDDKLATTYTKNASGADCVTSAKSELVSVSIANVDNIKNLTATWLDKK